MLARLIDLSIQHRGLVLVAAAGLAVSGFVAMADLPFDAFPDTTPVQVAVNTTAPALTPLEVERQITFPLERAMGALPDLIDLRSVSKFGFSQLVLVFADGSDLYRARQVVTERLHGVGLPAGVNRPSLGPISTGLGEIFHYLIRSDSHSLMELRTLQDWVVRPQLLAVPGVAEVNTWGGEVRQVHISVDPYTLLEHDIGLDQLQAAVSANTTAVGGGFITDGGAASLVQGTALAGSASDVARIVVTAREGVPIVVGDLARVEDGHQIRRGAVTADGRGETVLGLGFMLVGENSREVSRQLGDALEEAQSSVPEGVVLESVYSRSSLVDTVLRTVRTNLVEGALLVVAVLFIFLGNLRAGLIVASAIPLSMLFAFNGMKFLGVTGTLMSLGAIDFGLIVDSSVIMVENASRRLAQASGKRSVREVVLEAALEVRRPTLFGELIIAVVYLPILTLQGVEGKLFRPMALTVVLALAGSMLLSVTVIPALASFGLRRGQGGDTALVRLLQRGYRPLLEWALCHRRTVLTTASAAVLAAAMLATGLGSEFVPRLAENSLVINTIRLAGIPLEESVRYGTQIERLLLERFPDEIKRVWTRTGTAEVATDPMGLELSDVFIDLKPRKLWAVAGTQAELVSAMSSEISDLPGMRAVFTQPIEMRVNEMVAGVRADLGIAIHGEDYEVLEDLADRTREIVQGIAGATDVTVEQVTGLPVVEVEIDREAIARYGIAARQVLTLVEALGERQVGEIHDGQTRFDIVIRLDDRYRENPEKLAEIPVASPGGRRIPLAQLARIRSIKAPATVHRQWGKRRVVVQANVRGRDIGTFVKEVRHAVAENIEVPTGVFIRYTGQFEHLERAQNRLMLVVPLALVLVFTLLYLTYGRAVDAARVFTGVPFAAVGGVAALWLRGMPFSVSAWVGFVALSGVAVLGDMVLVARIRQRLAAGLDAIEAVREAADSRLRPVLMTALVAGLGFVPMALNTGIGAEVQRPLATVVIGGIVTSTLATLIVLPVLYTSFTSNGRPES